MGHLYETTNFPIHTPRPSTWSWSFYAVWHLLPSLSLRDTRLLLATKIAPLALMNLLKSSVMTVSTLTLTASIALILKLRMESDSQRVEHLSLMELLDNKDKSLSLSQMVRTSN